jgi:hypothetical protein
MCGIFLIFRSFFDDFPELLSPIYGGFQNQKPICGQIGNCWLRLGRVSADKPSGLGQNGPLPRYIYAQFDYLVEEWYNS